jgi:hypothetical protein
MSEIWRHGNAILGRAPHTWHRVRDHRAILDVMAKAASNGDSARVVDVRSKPKERRDADMTANLARPGRDRSAA